MTDSNTKIPSRTTVGSEFRWGGLDAWFYEPRRQARTGGRHGHGMVQ